MARLSDVIETFIKTLMNETNGMVEIQRNELATHFKCVPSQINYVIDTRFTSERGYFVESRRGGGGHIRIKRINLSSPARFLMHAINTIGDCITQQEAESFIDNFADYEIITPSHCALIKSAISDKVIGGIQIPQRDIIRSRLLKNMLLSLIVS